MHLVSQLIRVTASGFIFPGPMLLLCEPQNALVQIYHLSVPQVFVRADLDLKD